MPANSPLGSIERRQPFGPLTPQRPYVVPFDQIRPVIRIAHRQVNTPLRIAPRIIFDHEFVLFLKGRGRLVIGNKPRPFQAGDLLLIPPFRPHQIDSDAGQACEHIAVHWDFGPQIPARSRDPSRRQPYTVSLPGPVQLPRQVHLARHDRIESEFRTLVQARETNQPTAPLVMRACLLQIIAALLERQPPAAGEDARNRQRVERAAAYVAEHLHEPLAVGALAELAGLSASHFNRVFREATGYSPLEYIRRQRVAQARALLTQVDLSIKEIAARVGFGDPYHFSKAFRQLDGLSPTQYREAALAGRRR